jgi:hypothetical protein
LSIRSFRNWRSFSALARIFKNRKYSHLLQETGKLHDHAISEFARIDAEIGSLYSQAVPEVERLSGEVSRLRDHVASEFARIDAEQGKLDRQAVGEIARLRDEIVYLHDKSAKELDQLRDELSRLHNLVTARLVTQLEYLNREIYFWKRGLYHSNATQDEQAFNGQFSKHRIFDDLCAAFSFQSFVETGANLGSTTRFLGRRGKPVYAVEIDKRLHDQAKELLRNEPQVHLELGESSEFLNTLTRNTLGEADLTFFYLDAHWGDHLPLPEELNIIATHHARAVVMIDDFKIEDDPGYGYDSYESGQGITVGFLKEELRRHGWQVFFPVLPSAHDHMTTDILPPRGTAVTSCDAEIVRVLWQISSLRHWPSVGLNRES